MTVLKAAVPFAFVLFGVPGTQLRAQDASTASTITTERPTLGPSPDVVELHAVQTETGVGMSLQSHHRLVDFPETFLRINVKPGVELRLAANNLTTQLASRVAAATIDSSDLSLSGKMLMGRANGLLPRSGIVTVSLPTGGKTLTSGSVDPGLSVIWTQSVWHGVFVNEVVQGGITTLHESRSSVWSPSLAAGLSVTERFAIVGEYAPSVLADRSCLNVYDIAATYALNKNRQFDLRIGYQTDSTGGHTLLNLGYSLRVQRTPSVH